MLKANPWFAEALPVVEGAKSRPVTRAISAGVRRDPQQHERVPRRDQDHRRGARRHEEPAPADLPLNSSSPRRRGPSVFRRTTLGSRVRGNDGMPMPLSPRRDLSERALGAVLLAPAALLLLVIVVYPIATLLWNSLHTVDPANAAAGETFAGLANYARALDDERFWHSFVEHRPLRRRDGARVAHRGTRARAARQPAVHRQVAGASRPAAAVGAAARVRRPHLPLVLRVQHGRRQRLAGARSGSSRCNGCRARRSRSGPSASRSCGRRRRSWR